MIDAILLIAAAGIAGLVALGLWERKRRKGRSKTPRRVLGAAPKSKRRGRNR